MRNIEIFERALAQYLAVSPDSDEGTGACLEWENFRRERDTGSNQAVAHLPVRTRPNS